MRLYDIILVKSQSFTYVAFGRVNSSSKHHRTTLC